MMKNQSKLCVALTIIIINDTLLSTSIDESSDKMSKTIKEIHKNNTQIIRDLLKENPYNTKSSLSQDSGLSVATCYNILTQLLALDEAVELTPAPSSGGRPSRRFTYNKDYQSSLALYIRKEDKDITVYSVLSNSINEEISHQLLTDNNLNIESLCNLLSKLLNAYTNVQSIAISIPGIINDNTIIECDIPALNGFKIKSYVEEKHQISTVIENDVNIVITGYHQHFRDNPPESICFLYFPKNGLPGMGIIINGKIIKGYNNFSGEIKHTLSNRTFDDLLNIQRNGDKFTDYILELIQSISSIINPEYMIFSGLSFSKEVIQLITHKMNNHTLKAYFPKLIFEDDIHDSLIIGLKHLNQTNIKSIHGGQTL